jgi:hypothetical protein
MAFSLMNGLSEMGKGIAQYAGTAGLEMQKADMQQQALRLADQLATTREQEVTHPFQAGQQQNLLAAEAARSAANNATTLAAANISANADPAEVKLLRALGALPAAGGSIAPSPPSGSGTSSATPTPASSSATPSGATPPTDRNQALINSVLKIPQAGSEGANRAAVAADVNNDPAFKDKSPGQKAAEIENRLAVAGAKIGSKDSLDSIAQQIANYDLSPLDARARMTAGGPEVMAKVKELNPKYNEANYAAVVEAKKAITPGGSLFTPISAMETSLGHADHFLDLATKLGNYEGGNWVNIFPNKIASNTGSGSLVGPLTQTAFAMAEEGNRIYAGNAGTEGAINNWVKSFPINGSLADQAAAVKNFAQLMGDKFDTMKYHLDKTFKESGIPPVELLSPKGQATYERLTTLGPDGKPKPGSSGTDQTSTFDGSAAPSHPPLPPGFRVLP